MQHCEMKNGLIDGRHSTLGDEEKRIYAMHPQVELEKQWTGATHAAGAGMKVNFYLEGTQYWKRKSNCLMPVMQHYEMKMTARRKACRVRR